jgi:hypothetical protein
MMRPSGLVFGWFLSALLVGCGAELGGGAGVEAKSAHAIGYGRAAASTRLGTPLNDHGFLVGSSLESRAEQRVGARYDAGLMLGWGTGPAAIGGKWGFEAYGEVGTPLQSAIFREGNCFFGAAISVPYHLAKPREVKDLNDSVWIATTYVELVPMMRARLHLDHPGGGDTTTKIDISGGLAFRLRVLSDLL